jgi:hypothetical protein
VFQFALKVADDNTDGFVALLVYYGNFVYAFALLRAASAGEEVKSGQSGHSDDGTSATT